MLVLWMSIGTGAGLILFMVGVILTKMDLGGADREHSPGVKYEYHNPLIPSSRVTRVKSNTLMSFFAELLAIIGAIAFGICGLILLLTLTI